MKHFKGQDGRSATNAFVIKYNRKNMCQACKCFQRNQFKLISVGISAKKTLNDPHKPIWLTANIKM